MRLLLTLILVASLFVAGNHEARAQGAARQPDVWNVDLTRGTEVHRAIVGHTWEFYRQSPVKGYATMMRGVAGGLAADNFDWRTVHAASSGGKWGTTLQYLRDCRDNGWMPVITANVRGILQPGGGSTFANADPEMLARMASDWVRYCNHVVHRYKQGDRIDDPEDRRIVESMKWGDASATLPEAGEPAMPKVQYWEIGNEPSAFAGNLPNKGGPLIFTHRPDDYVHRYRTIASAMKRADPSLRIGPCFADDFKDGDLEKKPFVMALLRATDVPLDFLSYHKYAHLNLVWPDEGAMLDTLRGLRRDMDDRHARCVSALAMAGRDPATVELAVTELNAASWGINSAQLSMGRALGTAIYMHGFAEHGYRFATQWDAVAYDGAPWPTALLMQRYHRDLGTVHHGRYRDASVDLIAVRGNRPNEVSVWGFNLDPRQPRRIALRMNGIAGPVTALSSSLGATGGGPTSILDRNTPQTARIGWSDPIELSYDPAQGVVEIDLPPLAVTQCVITGDLKPVNASRRLAASEPGPGAPKQRAGAAVPATAVPATATATNAASGAVDKLTAKVADGASTVRLSWQPTGRDVQAYVVERCDDAIEFVSIGEVAPNVTTYDDAAVERGGNYQYRVVTRLRDGRSVYSSSSPTVSLPQDDAPRNGGSAVASDNGATLQAARLLAHWPLDPKTGLANLIAPAATASTLIGTATLGQADGRDALIIERGGYASLVSPPNLPLGPGREATISLWLQTTDVRGVVFARNESHDGPASYEYGLMIDPPGRLRWMSSVYIRGFKSQIGSSDGTVADGAWHHVAIAFRNNVGRFYIDGKASGEFKSVDWNVGLTGPLLLGANHTFRPGMVNPSIGAAIADLRFYDRALDVQAIAELAASPLTPRPTKR